MTIGLICMSIALIAMAVALLDSKVVAPLKGVAVTIATLAIVCGALAGATYGFGRVQPSPSDNVGRQGLQEGEYYRTLVGVKEEKVGGYLMTVKVVGTGEPHFLHTVQETPAMFTVVHGGAVAIYRGE